VVVILPNLVQLKELDNPTAPVFRTDRRGNARLVLLAPRAWVNVLPRPNWQRVGTRGAKRHKINLNKIWLFLTINFLEFL
jgi:hypothetical protein